MDLYHLKVFLLVQIVLASTFATIALQDPAVIAEGPTARWLSEDAIDLAGYSHSQIHIDEKGLPHLFYLSGGLKHAYWDVGEWTEEDVEWADDPLDGRFDSEITPDGYEHIMMMDRDEGLKYIFHNESGWRGLITNRIGIEDFSLAIDSTGIGHIVYSDGDRIIYDHWYGASFGGLEVAEGDFRSVSIAVDESDDLGIAAVRDGAKKVQYFEQFGYKWDEESIDAGETVIKASLLYGPDRAPNICYVTGTMHLYHSIKEGDKWSKKDLGQIQDLNFSMSFQGPSLYIIADGRYMSLTTTSDIGIEGFRSSANCFEHDTSGRVHATSVIERGGVPTLSYLTYNVENNRPITNLRPVREIDVRDTLVLDGSNSSDDSGIASRLWTIEYLGKTKYYGTERVELELGTVGYISVTYNLTDIYGNVNGSHFGVRVIDKTPLTAYIDCVNTTIRLGDTLYLSGRSSHDDTSRMYFSWTVLGEYSSWERSITLQNLPVGTVNITLRVEDASQTVAVTSLDVKVVDPNPPRIAKIDSLEVRSGGSVHLSADGSQDDDRIVSYVWNITKFGSRTTLRGEEVDFKCSRWGDYHVTLTVTDASGNSNTTEFIVRSLPTTWSLIAILTILVYGPPFAILIVLRSKGRRKDDGTGALYSMLDPPETDLIDEGPERTRVVHTEVRPRDYGRWLAIRYGVNILIGFLSLNVALAVLALLARPDYSILIASAITDLFGLGIIGLALLASRTSFSDAGSEIMAMNNYTFRPDYLDISYKHDRTLPATTLYVNYPDIMEIHRVTDEEWGHELGMRNPLKWLKGTPKKTHSTWFPPGSERRDILTIVLRQPMKVVMVSDTPSPRTGLPELIVRPVDHVFINVPAEDVGPFIKRIKKGRVHLITDIQGSSEDEQGA